MAQTVNVPGVWRYYTDAQPCIQACEGHSESVDRTAATFSTHIKAGSPHCDTGLWESDTERGGKGVGRRRWGVGVA